MSGWALQAAVLPPPTPATRVAANASAWLHDYRLTVDVFHVEHRRLKGACLRGWFPRPHESKARASMLSLAANSIQLVPERHHPWLAASRGNDQPARLLALVGCSGELASVVAEAAQSGGHLTTERGYAANQPVDALELEHGKDARLTLYVSPRSFRPLVAFVDLNGRKATSRLYLTAAVPSTLNRFDLYREAPGQRR